MTLSSWAVPECLMRIDRGQSDNRRGMTRLRPDFGRFALRRKSRKPANCGRRAVRAITVNQTTADHLASCPLPQSPNPVQLPLAYLSPRRRSSKSTQILSPVA